MKERAKILFSHPLISGGTIVFAGSLLANIFNYIFNLTMGRLLSVSDYGLYFTLTSIIGLFSIFIITFQNILAKFAAKYFASNNKLFLSALIRKGFLFIFIFSFIVFLILILTRNYLGVFLKVDDQKLVFAVIILIVITILSSLPIGILQGKMKFHFLSFTTVLVALLKIAFGITFVLIGLKVFGVLFALIIAFLIPYFISLLYIHKDYHKENQTSFSWKMFIDEFKGYSFRYLLASLGIVIISYVDVILVRHFFSPEISGQYAALSLMGKAILFLTAPINFVFFPLIAQKKEKKEKLFGTLFLAGIIITLFSASLSFIYFLFPWLILKIFFPAKEYAVLSPYLGPYSLYILVFSIASLLSNFFLSMGKTGIYKINIVISLIFIILIIIFHNSLYQIIGILFFVSFLLLTSFLIYYRYNAAD